MDDGDCDNCVSSVIVNDSDSDKLMVTLMDDGDSDSGVSDVIVMMN